jgi:uncharacterized protein (DUF433 family)
MVAQIIDRGRGPEIAGTRITVYDVMDYRKHGWHRDRIAAQFRLSSDQIQAALDYIDAHEQEVAEAYQRILDRQKNPPEIQAKLDACRGLAKRRAEELRALRNRNGRMPTILCDHDIEGQFRVLVSVWTSAEWIELWQGLNCSVQSLAGLGLPEDLPCC